MPGPPSSDLTTIVVAIMGSGLVSGIAVAIKIKPERDVLVMTKTKDNVLVQSTLIDDMEQVQEILRKEVAGLREELAAERALRRNAQSEVFILIEQTKILERDAVDMKQQIKTLVVQVDELIRALGDVQRDAT